MQTISQLTIEVSNRNPAQRIFAKQGDNNTRILQLTLTDNGTQFTPEAGTTAVLRCKKPDGHITVTQCDMNTNGTIQAALPEQVLAVPGLVQADVALYNQAGSRLSTFNFDITVEPAPVNGDTSPSGDDLTFFVNAIANSAANALAAQSAATQAVLAANRAENAATGSGAATDQQVSDAVEQYFQENPVTAGPAVDDTLSTQGAAAEAKATGAKLSLLQTKVDAVADALHAPFSQRGSMVTCYPSAGSALAIKSILSFQQQGVGQASLSNVRPIVGFETVTLSRSEDQTQLSVSLPKTVADGSFDWDTGMLTVNRLLLNLPVANMNNAENYPGWSFQDNFLHETFGAEKNGSLTTLGIDHVTNIGGAIRINTNSASVGTLYIGSSGMTQSQWKTQYPDLVVQICLPLSSPSQIQLDDQTITAVSGSNTLQTNWGELIVSGQSDLKPLVDQAQAKMDCLIQPVLAALPDQPNGYIGAQTGIAVTTAQDCYHTDLLPLSAYTKLDYCCQLNSAGAAVAFYDKEKTYLPSLSIISSSGLQWLCGTIDLTDSSYTNAAYVAFSSYHTSATSLAKFSGKLYCPQNLAELQEATTRLDAVSGTLAGRNINILGDSISSTDYTRPTWWEQIAATTGVAFQNYSISGTSLAYVASLETEKGACFVNRYVQMDSNADAVIVMGGTNDNTVPLGAWSSVDTSTFYGALNVLIPGLLNKYPGKPILFCTMMQTKSGFSENTADPKAALTATAATATITRQLRAEAIKAKCRQYGIPCLDLYHTSGISGADSAGIYYRTSDALHPSSFGMQRLSAAIGHALTKLFCLQP